MDIQSNFMYIASVTQRGKGKGEERGGGERRGGRSAAAGAAGGGSRPVASSHLSAGCAGRALLNCPTDWTACRGDSGQEGLEA